MPVDYSLLTTLPSSFGPLRRLCQDLKPSNVAVNEDCELRVSA